jgi:trigger factor
MRNIQIESVSDVKKKVTVEIPEDEVQTMLDNQYRDLKKTVQIKGFRKGKVPLNIIRSYFKDQVQADTIRKIIEDTLQPGLDEKKIIPVSVLNIDPETLEVGKPFKYTAEIEVPPPLEPVGYKGLKLKKVVRELKEKDVNERLENLRERNATLAPISEDRGVKTGDQVTIDVDATSEGEAIPALSVTDYLTEMGRNFYLPDFDQHFEGMKVDETREFTVDLPEDFQRKSLAGKTVSFKVSVKEAKERKIPELDDDFAKDLGLDSLEVLIKEVREDIEKTNENQSKKEVEEQIVDALVAANSFEVPDTMVESQIDNLLNQTLYNLAAHGLDPRKMPPPTDAQRNQMRPAAERLVRTGLLLKSIAETEQLAVSDEELDAGIKERAENLGMSVDYLRDQLDASKALEDMRFSLLQEKVFSFIRENAEITEEEPQETEASQTENKE